MPGRPGLPGGPLKQGGPTCCVRGLCHKARLDKSLAARASLLWAVCGLANPRHRLGVGAALLTWVKPNADHFRELFHCGPTNTLIHATANPIGATGARRHDS